MAGHNKIASEDKNNLSSQVLGQRLSDAEREEFQRMMQGDNIKAANSPKPPPSHQNKDRAPRPVKKNTHVPLQKHDAHSCLYYARGTKESLLRLLHDGDCYLEDQIDLHNHSEAEAELRLRQFLWRAHARGLRCVRVITGKGRRSPAGAILRPMVHKQLCTGEHARAFCPAQEKHGGDGAFYVLLRARQS